MIPAWTGGWAQAIISGEPFLRVTHPSKLTEEAE